MQPPSTTVNARVPTQVQVHRPGWGAGPPVRLPRASWRFSMTASPAGTAPPGPQTVGGPHVPCPHRAPPSAARLDRLPHLTLRTHRFPLHPHPQPRIGARFSGCGQAAPRCGEGGLRGALPRGSAQPRDVVREVCAAPCSGGSARRPAQGSVQPRDVVRGVCAAPCPGVQTRLCLPRVLAAVPPG